MKAKPGTNFLIKISKLIILVLTAVLFLTSCKKKPTSPDVTTANISEVTRTSAISGGNVTDEGGAGVTARGVCWSDIQSPTTTGSKTTDGAGPGTFISNISGLTPNKTYYVRAYAINSEGTSYGNEISFTTNPISLATLTTSQIASFTSISAVSGGNITDDGGGAIIQKGVCWSSTIQTPTTTGSKTTDGPGPGSYTSTMTGLSPGTTYYVRAYAENSAGTAYAGNVESFTTEQITTVTDIDGNVYNTVIIGEELWFKENLKTTRYLNGDPITNVTDGLQWQNLTTGAYCNYENTASYAGIYGHLYNWYAVNDSRKLCPAGWHVSTSAEMTTLSYLLEGEDEAGGELKETGTEHWNVPNTGATNSTGFTALPGGYRGYQGNFGGLGQDAYFWTSTQANEYRAYLRTMTTYDASFFGLNWNKYCGMSVRCVKD